MSALMLPRARQAMSALRLPCVMAAVIAGTGAESPVRAQEMLPPITVETAKPTRKSAPRAAKPRAGAETKPLAESVRALTDSSLTVPTTAETQANLARVPGAVTVVPDTAYKTTTPATTIKDVLDYVPGVFAEPKWGEDTRLSIRGSGLSRNFHLRGVQLFMDGIPINTADGYGDFQEIDPSAYRYVEVYKGANALRYGVNALGGAINFVTPTGRDASLLSAAIDIGSFGYHRLQASSGGSDGAYDYFITASTEDRDGFREHSWGSSTRASANFGYRISADVETRFYINANDINQRIPGSVTKDVALSSPTTAFPLNVTNDWQRNIDSLRLANKTTFRLAPTTSIDVGTFVVDRHLMHPIFQWLDYRYVDYGGFVRLTDERLIGDFKNRLIVGANLHNGDIDNRQFTNLPGAAKGALLSASTDSSVNLSSYAENAFYFLPTVALVTATQFLHATRDRKDLFLSDGNQSGSRDFNVWSPKVGLLWDVDKTWQVFGNISRSVEVPSFGENNFVSFSDIKAQTATTYEVGTRGRRPDLTWDLAAYRMQIDNELQCLFSAFGNCTVVNADHTVHQGVEIGFGAAIAKSIFAHGTTPDRLWWNTAYTFSDFRFDNDAQFANNQLPGAPRHKLRTELLYKHPSGFYFGPNAEWVPQAYYVDSANTLKTEPYPIWGLKLGFDDGGRVSAYLEGRNLSNEAYIASASIIDKADASMPLFEPGTGRAVYAGVKYKW